MDITQRIMERVSKYREIDVSEIAAETSIESLDMDSLDLINLVCELEEEFRLSIPDEEVMKMKTIGEMSDRVEKLLSLRDGGLQDAT